MRHLPNAITAVRLLLIPAFVLFAAQDRSIAAAATIAVSAASDWVDGWLARRWAVESRFGAVLDPLADKLTQATAIAVLAMRLSPAFTPVSPLLLGLLVGRELVLLYGAVRIRLRHARVAIVPRLEGKLSTFIVFTLVLAACLRAPQAVVLSLEIAAAPFIVLSAVRYFLDGRRQFAGAA